MPKTPAKTQKTAKGYEIPIPTRREVYAALGELAKVATPLPPRAKPGSKPKRQPRKSRRLVIEWVRRP
jgi:hypothetical protein